MPAGYDQAGPARPGRCGSVSIRAASWRRCRFSLPARPHGLLLPRLLYRLESQLHANLANPEFVYQALKVYLMLGVQGPLDKDFVAEWMNADWTSSSRARPCSRRATSSPPISTRCWSSR